MLKRNRSIQSVPLSERLDDEAKRLRKEAKGTQPGAERSGFCGRLGRPRPPCRWTNGWNGPAIGMRRRRGRQETGRAARDRKIAKFDRKPKNSFK